MGKFLNGELTALLSDAKPRTDAFAPHYGFAFEQSTSLPGARTTLCARSRSLQATRWDRRFPHCEASHKHRALSGPAGWLGQQWRRTYRNNGEWNLDTSIAESAKTGQLSHSLSRQLPI